MSDTLNLISLATATPPHVLRQTDAAHAAAAMFEHRFSEFRHLVRVFDNAGIRTRHLVRPLAWFHEDHGWPDRTAAYIEEAGKLFVEAARKALASAGLEASEIDTVVTVSSTGIATPSLEARVALDMGFRADIERVPVFGLGCAGGVSGLAIASRLARARPGANVLFVTVELCSLAFRLDELTRANIVATALFADGAAACVLRQGSEGIASVESAGEHLFPDTLGIMGWKTDETGLGVLLQQSLPDFVRSDVGPAVNSILARAGLAMEDIDRFICHPGGTKVIAALENALSLNQGSLDHERAVLSDFGNMSAPTVLFVLERVLREGLPERSAMLAMGPGFSASCLTLKRAA